MWTFFENSKMGEVFLADPPECRKKAYKDMGLRLFEKHVYGDNVVGWATENCPKETNGAITKTNRHYRRRNVQKMRFVISNNSLLRLRVGTFCFLRNLFTVEYHKKDVWWIKADL